MRQKATEPCPECKAAGVRPFKFKPSGIGPHRRIVHGVMHRFRHKSTALLHKVRKVAKEAALADLPEVKVLEVPSVGDFFSQVTRIMAEGSSSTKKAKLLAHLYQALEDWREEITDH